MTNIIKQFGLLRQVAGTHRGRMVLLLGVTLLEGLSASLGIVMILPLLDGALGQQTTGWLGRLLSPLVGLWPEQHRIGGIFLMMLMLIALKAALTILRKYLAADFAMCLAEQWTNRLYQRMLHAPFASLAKLKSGKILNNVVSEPAIASKYVISILDYLAQIIMGMVFVTPLFLLDWQATLELGAAGFMVWLVVIQFTRRLARRLGDQRLEAVQAVTSAASEDIGAHVVIKAFSLEKFKQAAMEKTTAMRRAIAIRFNLAHAIPGPIGELLAIIMVVAVVYMMTGFDVQQVKYHLPSLAVMIFIARQLLGNLSQIMGMDMQLAFRKPALLLVQEALTRDENPQEAAASQTFAQLEGDVCFKNVSFAYEADQPTLEHLDLTFARGKMTALVGPSGCGKSTIAYLLMGLIQPADGVIEVNGRSLGDYKIDSWRRRIGYVGQTPLLFAGSIRDNIRMGCLDASDQQIAQAARRAAIEPFILSLPGGYDTQVGERGLTLSGGQIQRIAIARAIVRDPEIYLFDEATSALDHESENAIKQSMAEVGRDKTVVVIAHRKSTIQNADVVYDLSQLHSTQRVS